jgi:hypothetical protein
MLQYSLIGVIVLFVLKISRSVKVIIHVRTLRYVYPALTSSSRVAVCVCCIGVTNFKLYSLCFSDNPFPRCTYVCIYIFVCMYICMLLLVLCMQDQHCANHLVSVYEYIGFNLSEFFLNCLLCVKPLYNSHNDPFFLFCNISYIFYLLEFCVTVFEWYYSYSRLLLYWGLSRCFL